MPVDERYRRQVELLVDHAPASDITERYAADRIEASADGGAPEAEAPLPHWHRHHN